MSPSVSENVSAGNRLKRRTTADRPKVRIDETEDSVIATLGGASTEV